jgi:AAA+ ATPase superfamily predicted ATPase
MSNWFYGRSETLARLRTLVSQPRWFFWRIRGRRRIGKTTIMVRELAREEGIGPERLFTSRLPDSDEATLVEVLGAR